MTEFTGLWFSSIAEFNEHFLKTLESAIVAGRKDDQEADFMG
jgi:hypothetical protein